MAIRVTEEEVGSVIDWDCTNIDLKPFITVANVIADKVSSCASDKGLSLTSAQLKEIERYLAAHLYALRDAQYQSKSTERASATFQGQTGMGLDLTWWGQTAKVLDFSGCLAAYSAGARASLSWLGKAPSDQTNYEDRD